MIHVVTRHNEECYRREMDQAYRLRHDVFVDEMGWSSLRKPDGRETDQFDTEHAVHMLYIEDEKVLGYQRLLPTTRPHLLSEVMSQLCDGKRPVGIHIWEWTRLCVAASHRTGRTRLCPITNQLLIAAVEWCLARGVKQMIIETNPIWLVQMVRLHFRPVPLGLMNTIAGEEVIACSLYFDQRTIQRLRQSPGWVVTHSSPKSGIA